MFIPTLVKFATVVSAVLGFASALMLWKYGMPATISRGGVIHIIAEQTDPVEDALAAKYDRLANVAVWMLVASFALQLVVGLYAFTQP